MVELVDTLGLGPRGNSLAGSSPAIRNYHLTLSSITSIQDVVKDCKVVLNDSKNRRSYQSSIGNKSV